MDTKTTFIYALCEPGTGRIRYIGKANNPKQRASEHIKKSIKMNTHLGNWIKGLISKEEKPTLEILDEVPYLQWSFWEREYIRVFRAIGMNLVNTSDGGEGLTMTPEIRAKISSGNLGKTCTLETRAKLSASKTGPNNPNFGKTLPPETCAKMSAARTGPKNHNFGKTLSAETILKRSASIRGIKRSRETCEKMSVSLRGLKRTPETRAKMSVSKSGASNPNFGKTASAEKRARMSAGQKAARARQKAAREANKEI